MSRDRVPYDEMDANIVELCRALNEFAAVRTIGSCGGHEAPTQAQWPMGSWYVKLTIEKTAAGWLDLEFLAWAINHDYRQVKPVQFLPDSVPPFANVPGQCLTFLVEGQQGADPAELATFVRKVREQYHGGE